MADIADLGIRIDSSPATKAAKELDALTVSASRADDAAQDLAATSRGRLSAGMSAGGQQSRMLAMQLSQVAQQASATGNFVQALAIQLPDMAMGFGAAGIAAGILASVTLPLLASAFGGTGDEARNLSTTLADMAAAVDTFTSSFDAAKAPAEELTATYGRLADEAQRALAAIAAADQAAALAEIKAAIDGVTESLLQTVTAREALAAGTSTRQLIEEFGLLKSEARAIEAALGALENAKGLEAQVAAASRVMNALNSARDSAGKLPPPLQAAYDAIARIVPKAAEVNAKTDQMAALLRSAAGAADAAARAVGGIGSAASNAYGAVSSLVSKMWEMGQARAAYSASVGGGRGIGPQGPALDPYGFRAQLERDAAMAPAGTGTGAGAGGADPYADNLKALVENLRSEREIETEWYEESLAILNDRRAQEILGKQAHDAAMVALHEEYQRRIAEIDANAGQQRISDTANLFGALASVAQAGGEKTAKIVATFQAIEGTINAYGAAIKALNTPGITLAGRFAAYASVLAAGLKGVAAIRAAGGVGGGGGAALAAQGATSAVAPRSSELIVNVPPNALMTADMWSQIFDGVFGEAKARGMNLFSGIRFAT